MSIEKDDFDAWRDNAVTQAVFAALEGLAERAKKAWVTASWDRGENDPLLLADLRARAECMRDVTEITFEELESRVEPDSGG